MTDASVIGVEPAAKSTLPSLSSACASTGEGAVLKLTSVGSLEKADVTSASCRLCDHQREAGETCQLLDVLITTMLLHQEHWHLQQTKGNCC